MKRLLLLFAGVFALAVIVAPTAGAATTAVSIDGPSLVMYGERVVLAVDVSNPKSFDTLTVYGHNGTTCPTAADPSESVHHGQADFGQLPPDYYTFRAVYHWAEFDFWHWRWIGHDVMSDCVTVHVAASEPGIEVDAPAEAQVNVRFAASGSLWTYDGAPLGDEQIVLTLTNTSCDVEAYTAADVVDQAGPKTSEDGSFMAHLGATDDGTYAVWAYNEANDLLACDEIHIIRGEVIPPPLPSDELSSSYLCWNQEAANPVAYIDRVADEMWATGKYFEPIAVAGHLDGGTNIGAYHLICNPTGLVKTTGSLGSSGEVYGEVEVAGFNLTHATGNDLNQYHIWNTK